MPHHLLSVKAYENDEIQIKKSDWNVIHIANWNDTEMKMFKFKNGYNQINTDDVQRVYGIPNRGKQAPQSTKDSRIPKIGKTSLLIHTSGMSKESLETHFKFN